jgi:hypothetical protein
VPQRARRFSITATIALATAIPTLASLPDCRFTIGGPAVRNRLIERPAPWSAQARLTVDEEGREEATPHCGGSWRRDGET